MAGLVWREIAAGESWSHSPIGGLISLYAGANILFHVLALSGAATDLPARMALALVMVLLALIGGRVTPNFTREFLAEQGMTEQPASFSRFDGLSVVLVGIAAVAWIVQSQAMVTGWMLVGAGLVNLGRLLRWYGWVTWREPLVVILHLGYGWLAMSLLALGGAILGFGLPTTEAIARAHHRCRGCDDPGGNDPRQPGPYGAPQARWSLTVCIYIWSTWVRCCGYSGRSTDLSTNLVLGLAAIELEWRLSAVRPGLWPISPSPEHRRMTREPANSPDVDESWSVSETDRCVCSFDSALTARQAGRYGVGMTPVLLRYQAEYLRAYGRGS